MTARGLKRKQAQPRDWLYLYSTITMLLFSIRDGLTGSIRYFFSVLHVSFLWFIPDLLAFGSLALFIYYKCLRDRNILAIFFTAAFFFSVGVSVIFMNNNLFSLFSSMKMFVPIFVGLGFYGRTITEKRWVRIVLFVIFVSSALGLILNPYFEYPWVGQTIDSLGVERQATKLWWTEGQIRYGGLAGDSTMAAYMTVFTFVLVAPYLGLLVNLAIWPFIFWAIQVSTSKTALLVFLPFIALYLSARVMRSDKQVTTMMQKAALASYLCLLIPPVAIILLSGVDLTAISSTLFSLADRINNTWQQPFVYIAELFPIGLFIGCGIGCYSYPMDYTDYAAYQIPLDNFYLTTFLMMGYPFLVFVLAQIKNVHNVTNREKLLNIMMFNLYSVTIQCYGPSYATLMYGYAVSDFFHIQQAPRRVHMRKRTFARHAGPPDLAARAAE